MSDPISANLVNRLGPVSPATPAALAAPPAEGDGKFTNVLRDQLEKVSRMQNEADEGLQRVLTGQSQNVTEVFSAARKAQVAFSLLMEIRNKLVSAYDELKQLRV